MALGVGFWCGCTDLGECFVFGSREFPTLGKNTNDRERLSELRAELKKRIKGQKVAKGSLLPFSFVV